MPTFGNYVCVKCGKSMRPKENGIRAVEMADFGPYKIWMADLWKCPSCGIEIISGFGNKPEAGHFQPDFTSLLANYEQDDNCTIIRFD